MTRAASPREVVESLVEAYNGRDLDAYCALFAADAVILDMNQGREIARGADDIRTFFKGRFKGRSDLHCAVKARIELGPLVVDHEVVSGVEDQPVDAICLYEVRNGRIDYVRYIRPRP